MFYHALIQKVVQLAPLLTICSAVATHLVHFSWQIDALVLAVQCCSTACCILASFLHLGHVRLLVFEWLQRIVRRGIGLITMHMLHLFHRFRSPGILRPVSMLASRLALEVLLCSLAALGC